MSIFSNPSANFSTAPFVLETQEINLMIYGVKAKKIDGDDGAADKAIINLNIRIVGGEYDGKALFPVACWYEEDGSNPQVMPWIMAALGIRAGSEEADNRFREEFGALDFGFNEDTLEPNDGWERVLQSVVTASVKKNWNKKKEEYVNYFNNVRPLEVG